MDADLLEITDLSIAVEADFFIGHLHNNAFADLVNMLQRTRGDGGNDFHSIDEGSSYQSF